MIAAPEFPLSLRFPPLYFHKIPRRPLSSYNVITLVSLIYLP